MISIHYEEALAYLRSLQRFGIKPGLERTTELLRRLGYQRLERPRIIHVTGTNGKGSISAMIEACLRAAGYRVGMYISPDLGDFTERMQVNRKRIPPADVAAMITSAKTEVDAMTAEGLEQPTEFEVFTAAALVWFSLQRLDWLVLEVGLGGRYDSTNVIPDPVLTIISNVSLDHTRILGETEEEIAWDKAGIIKSGVPCVTGVTHPGALQVITAEAERLEAPLHRVVPAWMPLRHDLTGQVFHLATRKREYREMKLRLLGRHQLANAACAVTAVEAAESWTQMPVPAEAIRKGLATVEWPARLEVMRGADGTGPLVVVDGAHNPSGAEMLAQAVVEYFGGRRLVLVVGMLADKQVDAALTHLVPLAASIVVTEPPNPRAMSASELAERVQHLGTVPTVLPDPGQALRHALDGAGDGDAVLVAGSLFLAGKLRSLLVDGV